MSNRLARAMAGLPPDQEAQFQTFMAFDPNVRAWKNSFQNRFGEPPNIENSRDFDYRKAWQAGEAPHPYAPDGGMPHWGSAGKSDDHPTAWMNTFMQQFGVDPMTIQPHEVTPSMQQFMQQQIGRDQTPLVLPANNWHF